MLLRTFFKGSEVISFALKFLAAHSPRKNGSLWSVSESCSIVQCVREYFKPRDWNVERFVNHVLVVADTRPPYQPRQETPSHQRQDAAVATRKV